MAGTFPNLCLGQQIDGNGRPLVGAVLTIYNGGTLQQSAVYQDFGLTIAAQNPMRTDATGRLPIFFVADATYRCILVDATGVSILDVTLPSIGPSGGGGGGGGVDPTTIFATGDELWKKIGGVRTGWVRQNALTIGSATSGASERANADCQNLFLYLWNNYTNAKCPVVGGRGVSALADWGANKQITLPDMRGRSPAGLDGMGNARASVIPDLNVTSGGGDGGDTPAAFGGEANHALAVNEMPAHNHVDAGHAHGVTDPGHPHTDSGHAHSTTEAPHTHSANVHNTNGNFGNPAGHFPGINTNGGHGYSDTADLINSLGNGVTPFNALTATGLTVNSAAANIQPHVTGLTVNSAVANIQNTGGNAGHNNMHPFSLGTWYIKL